MSEVFVPEGGTPLSLDETLRRIIEAQKQKSVLDKTIKNLKKVAKTHLATRKIQEYESPEGHKAKFYDSQVTKLDKKGILELLGENFALVCEVITQTNFKVT
jgi:hypothetical protein